MPALICLTYDDALPVHRNLVAPMLTRAGMRGTFYSPAARDDVHEHSGDWRRLAADGHELGNHTCWHPCRGRPEWLPRAYHLEDYDRIRLRDELILANRILTLIDGREHRTFAATCSDTACGPGTGESFTDILAELFPAVRSGHCMHPLQGAEAKVLPSFHGDYRRSHEIIEIAQSMQEQPDALLIVLFHGVGSGTHNAFIDIEEHRRVVEWIAQQRTWLEAVSVLEAVDRRRRSGPTPPSSG